jgi:hypothetical protein
MHIVGLMLLSALLVSQGDEALKVETTFDKTTNFAAFRTYEWTTGSRATDPAIDKLIVAAIDADMAGLGCTKADTGADVTITYHTVASTVVDLEALDKLEREGQSGPAPTRTRGRLVVAMRSGMPAKQVWAASAREYLDPDPALLDKTIRGVTARLFATYPGRQPARSR